MSFRVRVIRKPQFFFLLAVVTWGKLFYLFKLNGNKMGIMSDPFKMGIFKIFQMGISNSFTVMRSY